jgi:hypothetical protein
VKISNPSRTRIITFIGRLPPRVGAGSVRRHAQKPTGFIDLEGDTDQRRHRDPSIIGPGIYSTKHYPSRCTICGYTPPIPEETRAELRYLFSDSTHILPLLASSGLIHDRHLAILLALRIRDREEFCDRLPKNLFSSLDLDIITERLAAKEPTATTSEVFPPAPLPQTEQASANLQWPGGATRFVLMNTADFLPTLKHAMGLNNKGTLFTRTIVSLTRWIMPF